MSALAQEVAILMGRSVPTIDTAKAMSILGFGTSQTFESISYEEICNAFLTKSRTAMGTRKRAKSKMKAQYTC